MYIEWLMQKIENEYGDRDFMIREGRACNYFWLKNRVDYWKTYLKKSRIKPGEIASIEGETTPESIALLFALLSNKNIIVPLSNLPEAQKAELRSIAEVDVSLCFGNGSGEIGQNRSTGYPDKNKLTAALIVREEPGLILFSSGSTGKPKAILHNLNVLLEKFTNAKKSFKSLIFLLIDHIGGINTLFSIVSGGGTIVSIGARTPKEVCRSIEQYRIELLPATPTFLNLLLLSQEYKNYDLSSLKIISYGTEPMPEALLQRLTVAFPGTELKQTYGITEVGILSTKSRSSGSTWMKVGGGNYELKVVEGILWIKAKTSMLGYLNAPSPFTDDGWFITGDKVEVDGEYMRILGRESEIINVGGQKVFPSEVENLLIQMPEIKDVSVYKEKNPLLGELVCAKIVPAKPIDVQSLKKAIYAFCKERTEKYKIPVKIAIAEQDSLFGSRFKKIRR